MNLKTLQDTPPWEWPEGARKIFLEILRNDQADESGACSTMMNFSTLMLGHGRGISKMAEKKRKPNWKMQAWIEAGKRHHLTHVQIQMARELGINPNKLGKLDNHDQKPWKMPLRQYIEHLYFMRFGKAKLLE